MTQTAWGEPTWTEPEPVHLYGGEDSDIFPGYRSRYVVGKAAMGCVCWYQPEGPYYALTQLRRLGCVGDIDTAKSLVEEFSVLEVLKCPTLGNA
ncbi:protein of unknown function [Pseudorhizobium banfieldiae]|uniref:Uncharacterized protein n=1 Tax=Pseudorhizobium banfieldiae TaxID=1125847 RepID=L0NE47_9HYPH|nr:hypothetical protein [Pseudorhizobium banfieldiae]CAD6605818.1 hypothetical protein RNT25_01730 [arsenite-oxidising bacterium NT-25]CCF19076.1 protein of unknown function [Pseudorhizobium banfieldiae]